MPQGALQPLVDVLMQAAQLRNQDKARQQELSMEQARALAEQHWREVQAQTAERRADIEQQRADTQAQREEDYRKATAATAERQVGLLERSEKRDLNKLRQDAYNNWRDPKKGGTFSEATFGLEGDDEGLQRLRTAALADLKNEWQQRLQAATQKHLQSIPPTSPQGAMGGGIAGMIGSAANAAGQAAAYAQMLGKAHYDATLEVGPEPTEKDVENAYHPAVKRAMAIEEQQKKLSEQRQALMTSQMERSKFLNQYDRDTLKVKQDAEAEKAKNDARRNAIMEGHYKDMAAQGAERNRIMKSGVDVRRWYEGGELAIRKVLADATVSRAATAHDIALSADARFVARTEFKAVLDERKKFETAKQTYENKAKNLQAQINPNLEPDKFVIAPTTTTPGLTKAQADNLVLTYQAEAQDADKHIQELTNKAKEIYPVTNMSGPDGGPTNDRGSQLPFGTVIGGKGPKTPVGVMGSRTNPVKVKTPAEAAKLKPGSFYRTPDGALVQR